MVKSETVLFLSREEILLLLWVRAEIPGLLRLGRVTRMAGKKFLGSCPCQALV